MFFRVFARLVFYFPTPDHQYAYKSWLLLTWQAFILLFAVFACVVIFVRLFKAYKNRSSDFDKYLLLTIWLTVGILLFGFYKKEIYDYYFAFMFPLPFLLVSQSLDFLKNLKFAKTAGIIVFVLFMIIVGLNLGGVPFQYPANRQLNQMETIAKFVNDKTGGQPFNFALITGGNSDHAYRYFFTIWNHPPLTIEDPQHDPQRKTVTNQLFVVCESLPCKPLGNSLWEIAGFGQADIAGRWSVSVVEVYKLVHYKGK